MQNLYKRLPFLPLTSPLLRDRFQQLLHLHNLTQGARPSNGFIPRTKGSLGHVLQAPEEEKFMSTKEDLLAQIVIYLGGRAAEELIFHSITDGAANDIQQATALARSQQILTNRFVLLQLFPLLLLKSPPH